MKTLKNLSPEQRAHITTWADQLLSKLQPGRPDSMTHAKTVALETLKELLKEDEKPKRRRRRSATPN